MEGKKWREKNAQVPYIIICITINEYIIIKI
jgi:hypothetical protein